jgi:hypothetical protein
MFSVNVAQAGVPAIPALRLGVISCTAAAVPPIVRAEGIAELVGDIIMNCVNTPPGVGGTYTNTVFTNLSVSLNTLVTNNPRPTPNVDAILVINENNCEEPSATGGDFNSCAGGTPNDPRFQNAQYGVLADDNRVEWNGVAIPVPGAPEDPGNPDPDCGDGAGIPVPGGGCFPFTTTLRVTSIRANVNNLVGDVGNFPATVVQAFVSITGPTTIPVTNNVLNVAVPLQGLFVTGSGSVSGLQCIDTDGNAFVTLTEGFASSFKTLGVATFIQGNNHWESGYYADSNNGAGATQATQFLVQFDDIPDGVDIDFSGTSNCTGDLEIELIDGVDISGNTATAIFEVVDADPFITESCRLNFDIGWAADTGNDKPEIGSGSVKATFYPTSTVPNSSASQKEPRFVENFSDPRTVVTVTRCATTLLFPFVTNQTGFDTGIAISNTSDDWIGTDPQRGACDVHYIGELSGGQAAPDTQTSGIIEGGDQLIFTLSGGSPDPDQNIVPSEGFQGFLIVQCDFQYAHGYAFITDGFGGVPALAQGYLALVIPVTPYDGRIAGPPLDTEAHPATFIHLFGEGLNH